MRSSGSCHAGSVEKRGTGCAPTARAREREAGGGRAGEDDEAATRDSRVFDPSRLHPVSLREIPTSTQAYGHFEPIDPSSEAWPSVLAALNGAGG